MFSALITECLEQKAWLVLPGDLLDSTAPTKEEVYLLLDFLHKLQRHKIRTLIVSGNHETIIEGHVATDGFFAGEELVAASALDYLTLDQFDNVTYRESFCENGINFQLVSHDEIKTYQPILQQNHFNLLISHFRCNVNQFIKEEVDVSAITKGFDLCIVGDIHSSMNFGNVYYTNQPINSNFESNPNCGYLYVEIDPTTTTPYVERRTFDLPSLIQRKCTSDEWPIPLNDKDYFKVEVTGAPLALRGIKDAPPNTKLERVPLLQQMESDDEEDLTPAEVTGPCATLLEELIGHMKKTGKPDTHINAMVEEYSRP